MLASDNPEDQYKAYLWLHKDTHYKYVIENAERVLMMHHRHEWFKLAEVPLGKKAHNTYNWAFLPEECQFT